MVQAKEIKGYHYINKQLLLMDFCRMNIGKKFRDDPIPKPNLVQHVTSNSEGRSIS